MNYRITSINDADGWIFISADNSFENPVAFIELVKTIAQSVHGKITSIGNTQYQVSNVPFDLVFQWDSLFGIVVINNNLADKSVVLKFLKNYGIV